MTLCIFLKKIINYSLIDEFVNNQFMLLNIKEIKILMDESDSFGQ